MMNIALAGDINVLSGIELVIYSTMLHNKNIHWRILTMDCEVVDEHRGEVRQYHGLKGGYPEDWLKFLVNFMDYKSTIEIVDCKELYDQHLAHSVNRFTGFTPYAALRLLPDLFMPYDPQKAPNIEDDRLLYLDADVIVQKNLEPLYFSLLDWNDDYAAYVLPDACNGFGELISAVILYNLRHIRYSGFLNNARRNYNGKQYPYPDQGALADAGAPAFMPETMDYMFDHKLATYVPHILHFSNVNYTKIYNQSKGEAAFWKYYPEHRYLKDGLDAAKMTFENYYDKPTPIRWNFQVKFDADPSSRR